MKIFYSEFKTVDKKSKDIFIGDGLIVFAENVESAKEKIKKQLKSEEGRWETWCGEEFYETWDGNAVEIVGFRLRRDQNGGEYTIPVLESGKTVY